MKLLTRIAGTLALAALTGTTWASPSYAATTPKVSAAFKTPNLAAGFTPQGMTTTPSGKLLLAEYKVGSNTRLVDVTTSGKVYGQLAISETHAGGIAIVGQWLFVQNDATPGHDTVRAYRMADVNAALAVSHANGGHPAYVKAAHLQVLADWQWASFMTADGQQLLAGHHGVGAGARMYRFNVDQSSGQLSAVSYVMVPENAQGAAMGGRVFTSGGGHLTVDGKDVKVPSHAEGVAVINGVAFIAFEGGAKSVEKVKL